VKKLLALLLASPLALAGGELPPIPHGSTSQVIHFPLWDYSNGAICPATPVDHTTTDLKFYVFDNAPTASGYTDTFTETDGTLETIGTIRTYATPTATKARFKVAGDNCAYELQLPDAAFAGTGASRLNIVISDGATNAIADDMYWIDMSGVNQDAFVDLFWEESTDGYTTEDTFGRNASVGIEAIESDTGTEIPATLSTIETDTTTDIPALINGLTDPMLWNGVVDTVTSQTILVAENGPAVNDTHVGRTLCVTDAGDNQTTDCAVISDYVAATFTFTIANALKFTVATTDLLFIPANDSVVTTMNTGVVTSDAMATDAIGSAEWAATATSEVQSGLATSTNVSAVETDTQDIQSRLPSALGANGNIKADVRDFNGTAGTFASGRPEVNTTHAAGTAWNSGAITAATLAADAGTEIGNAMLDIVIGTYDGEDISVMCSFLLNVGGLFGEMTSSGDGPTLTFKSPDGNDTLAVVTMSGAARASSVITCP
jgi:hypothetical protein